MSDDAGTPPPSTPATPSLPAMPNLAILDPTSRMIAGGGAVALVVAVIGGLAKWWDSTDFLLLVMAGAILAAAAAWYTASSSAGPKPSTLPLSSIELIGAAVVVVLGVWRSIELIFDLDQLDGIGGVVDLLGALVVAGAGVVMLLGVMRRDPSLRSDLMGTSRGTRLAVGGLALVLLGWAIYLSFGYWRISAATLSLALATIAAALIVVAPRWQKALPEVPVAWVGSALGVVIILLALGLWGSLTSNQAELGLDEWLPFVAYVLGVVAIIAGGALEGQTVWAARPVRAAPPPPAAPSATPPAAPPAAPSEPPAAPSEPPAPTA
jgi:hypothetical protein